MYGEEKNVAVAYDLGDGIVCPSVECQAPVQDEDYNNWQQQCLDF